MIGETAQLILDRMKSNPEEFFRNETDRWTWLFREDAAELMSDDERNALQAEYEVIRKKEFHNKVLKTILHADRPEEVTETYAYHGNMIAGGGVKLGSGYSFAPQMKTNVTSSIIAPASMVEQARKILEESYKDAK